jgi:hypothetical protein
MRDFRDCSKTRQIDRNGCLVMVFDATTRSFQLKEMQMNMPTRIVLSLVIAVLAGGGYMAYDKMRGAEWVVSPQQIADAKASGQAGYESRPGTVTVLPIRSETADALPVKWAMIAVVGGLLAFRATGRKKAAKA